MSDASFPGRGHGAAAYVVDARDPVYLNALRREAAFWGRAADCQRVTASAARGFAENHPVLIRHQNAVLGLESAEETAWVGWLRETLGTFETGLSLGSGSGWVEAEMLRSGVVSTWQTVNLFHSRLQSIHRPPTGLAVDLNFARLPANQYSLVLCHGILHHIVNLEHLLSQVCSAVAPDGVVVVKEYVGEDKQQWSDAKIDYLSGRLRQEYPGEPWCSLTRKRLDNTESPFESVRSRDILPLLHACFSAGSIYERTWGVATYSIMLYGYFQARRHERLRRPEFVERVLDFAVDVDREVYAQTDSALLPCHLFGVYRKPTSVPGWSVSPWSSRELRSRLAVPLWQRGAISLRRMIRLLRRRWR